MGVELTENQKNDVIKHMTEMSSNNFYSIGEDTGLWNNFAEMSQFLENIPNVSDNILVKRYEDILASSDNETSILSQTGDEKQQLISEIAGIMANPSVWRDVQDDFARMSPIDSPAFSDNIDDNAPEVTIEIIEEFLQGQDINALTEIKSAMEERLPTDENSINNSAIDPVLTQETNSLSALTSDEPVLMSSVGEEYVCLIDDAVKLSNEDIHHFSQTDAVESIQIAISALGQEGIKADGAFGLKSASGLETILKDIQNDNGLPVTGDYNLATETAIRETIANMEDASPNGALNYEILLSGLEGMHTNTLENGISALDTVYNDFSRAPPTEPCQIAEIAVAAVQNRAEEPQALTI